MDQANELRNKMQEQATVVHNKISARVITITSGKGGVGKTNFTVNLAIYLSKKNMRVIILDADFGLANIEVLFGIVPKYSLADVLLGSKTIDDVLTPGPNGIQFISGGSGLRELANITDKQMNYLINSFTYLDQIADIILVDTGAGISNTVINFVKASEETIVVTTPEPTSITDAYALVKSLKEDDGAIPEIKIMVNRVDDEDEGVEIYNKLKKVSERFLGVQLYYLGSIQYDFQLIKAVKRQQPVITIFPNSVFSKRIEDIGDKLLSITKSKKQNMGIMSFMKRLVNVFGSPYTRER